MKRLRLVAAAGVLLLAGGCSVLFEPDGGEGPAPSCGPFAPFQTPEKVDLGFDDVDDPALSPDLLELYFNLDSGSGGQKILVSRREGLDREWGEPEGPPGVPEGPVISDPFLAEDRLTLWFCQGVPIRIYVLRWNESLERWGAPEEVPTALGSNDCPGWVNPGETRMLLRGAPVVDGQFDIFVARRSDPAEPWQTPVPLVQTEAEETAPFYLE